VQQHEHAIDQVEPAQALEPGASALLEPVILLASQHAMARPPDSPYRRLVAAMLERALLDAVGPTAREGDRNDALAWFGSDDETPFSFRWVAAQLGFDTDWLRDRVRRRQRSYRDRATPMEAPPAPLVESRTRTAA
jgi:hypothetical protein